MTQYRDLSLGGGDILLAPPRMMDHRFHKTVIMLTQERPEATLGLVINRQSNHTVRDVAREVCADLVPDDWPLYWGGPVNPQTIWMLHEPQWHLEGSTIAIDSRWSMTSNLSMFHHLADGDRPERFRVFFGFCSWQPGQLEREISGREPYAPDSSWLIWHDPDSTRLFEVEPANLWAVGCEQISAQAVASWM
jgi:putative transcriptional regulator